MVVVRAYYGLKADIINYVDLSLNNITNLYWDFNDSRQSENINNNLMIINVTVPLRLSLNDKFGEKGGLKL